MSTNNVLISDIIKQSSDMIEKNRAEDAYKALSQLIEEHPDWVDERLNAEIYILMRQMEYKAALKDYAFFRDLAVFFRECEKKYSDICRSVAMDKDECIPEQSNTIWWGWLQGLECAPDIVRSCYVSLKKLGRNIVVISEKNIHEYVHFPDFIEDKYQKGIISRAHYMDIVRLELLTKMGGTWIDATTWISGTEQIVPVLENADLFMFRSGNVSDYILLDNWFIHSVKKSKILEATRRMLYEYWKSENVLCNYFMMHVMMTLACQFFRDEFNAIPLFSNEPAHVLQKELFSQYNDNRWRQITRMSDVHKLTYKYNNDDYEGSFLKYLLSGRLG